MTGSGRTPGRPENSIIGGGTIYSGNFTGTAITTVTGHNNTTVSSVHGADPLLEQLRSELAKARGLLEQCRTEQTSTVNDTAIGFIDDVQEAIADRQGAADAGKLRRRLDNLITALTPLMGIIAGIAASVEVLKDIKSVVGG